MGVGPLTIIDKCKPLQGRHLLHAECDCCVWPQFQGFGHPWPFGPAGAPHMHAAQCEIHTPVPNRPFRKSMGKQHTPHARKPMGQIALPNPGVAQAGMGLPLVPPHNATHPLLPIVGHLLVEWLHCGAMGRVLPLVRALPLPSPMPSLAPPLGPLQPKQLPVAVAASPGHSQLLGLPAQLLPSVEFLSEVCGLLLLLFELEAGLWPQAWCVGPHGGFAVAATTMQPAPCPTTPTECGARCSCWGCCCGAIIRAELHEILEAAKLAASVHTFMRLMY